MNNNENECKECIEQARLLGMSAEREAELRGKLERERTISDRLARFIDSITDALGPYPYVNGTSIVPAAYAELREWKEARGEISATPEADAEAFYNGIGSEVVDANFARRLERERNDLRYKITAKCNICMNYEVAPNMKPTIKKYIPARLENSAICELLGIKREGEIQEDDDTIHVRYIIRTRYEQERALANELGEAARIMWPFIEEDLSHGCNTTVYMKAVRAYRAALAAWKEARSE